MESLGRAKRVRIYVNEDDRTGGKPLHLALLELLRSERAHGATVLRAAEGFGAGGEIHVSHLVDVAPRLPVIVEWIDAPEQVERLMPRVRAMVRHGLVTVDDTEVILSEPRHVRDVPATLTAGDVMRRDAVSVEPTTAVRKLVELVLGKVYRALPVVDGGRPVGIVTSGDLVRRGGLAVRVDLLPGLEEPAIRNILDQLSESTTAADVMTREVVTVPASAPLPEVAETMCRRRLKRLPVVDAAGALVGMVSRVDVLRAAAGGLGGNQAAAQDLPLAADAPLAQAVRRDVPAVRPDTPLPEVFQAVMATRLNRALVVDADGRVVGLVTDAELLERVTPALRPGALRALVQRLPFTHAHDEAGAHARGRTAADVMSRSFATAREDARLGDAITAMLQGNHKVLAAVDAEGRLVGIVDRADLLHALVSSPR